LSPMSFHRLSLFSKTATSSSLTVRRLWPAATLAACSAAVPMNSSAARATMATASGCTRFTCNSSVFRGTQGDSGILRADAHCIYQRFGAACATEQRRSAWTQRAGCFCARLQHRVRAYRVSLREDLSVYGNIAAQRSYIMVQHHDLAHTAGRQRNNLFSSSSTKFLAACCLP